MHFKPSTVIVIMLLLIVPLIAGCGQVLRFAPTEEQKQVALKTFLNARAVESSGTDARSPAAKQLVEGTKVSLDYIGIPANPDIADYEAVLHSASTDSVRRPVIEDVSGAVDKGLSLAAELAILFGVGGTGFGGKKLLDWLKLAKQKNTALKEVIAANELFKHKTASDAEITRAFKEAHNTIQKTPTKKIVSEIRIGA